MLPIAITSTCICNSFSQRSPSQSFPKIHGKTGVTNIICDKGNVYTTGRDGCYRVFSHEDHGHMTLLNTHRIYKGFEWIDKLEIADDGADFRVFGFQSVSEECNYDLV